jgi:putative transposase
MVLYLRNYLAGGAYFFTVTLMNRQSTVLIDHIDVFRAAVATVKRKMPFEIVAWVVLPDHCHAVWKLPAGDSNNSGRWRLIKSCFVRLLKQQGVPIDMRADGSAMLWQRRFWEHTVVNELDLIRCVEYCYLNPMKHQLVSKVRDWPYSSFHRDVALGLYPANWASDSQESKVA